MSAVGEYLRCSVCERDFDVQSDQRHPISLGCGHSVCEACLSNLKTKNCPFDQSSIDMTVWPINTALVQLIDSLSLEQFRSENEKRLRDLENRDDFIQAMNIMEQLATFLLPSKASGNNTSRALQVSRPMQRKLVTLVHCQLLENEGRLRACKAARSLGERVVMELILQHQNSQQLSSNLWAAVRARGCQFLGPAMQEEVLKLVLLALEDGSALSRKVLVMFVVQRLEAQFPQASKTSVGHVVQLLYRASCFKVTKREGDSSLMELKEEFRSYETLRREHDAQVVQIATEAGLRIAPDQWSSLLYGDSAYKSHMQSIIDKMATPQAFAQAIQELVIAIQRTGDPANLQALRTHLDLLAAIDNSTESGELIEWVSLLSTLTATQRCVQGLLQFMEQYPSHRRGNRLQQQQDFSNPRVTSYRGRGGVSSGPMVNRFNGNSSTNRVVTAAPPPPSQRIAEPILLPPHQPLPYVHPQATMPPVAQVAPVPRGLPGGSNGFDVINQANPHQAMINIGHGQHVVGVAPIQPQLVFHHPPPPLPATPQQQQQQQQGPPVLQPHQTHVHHHHENVVRSEHDSNVERFPLQDDNNLHVLNSQVAILPRVATRSLMALRSRKEEIIDHLEDLLGKEEIEKLKGIAHSPLKYNDGETEPTDDVTNIEDNQLKLSDHESIEKTSSTFSPLHSFKTESNTSFLESIVSSSTANVEENMKATKPTTNNTLLSVSQGNQAYRTKSAPTASDSYDNFEVTTSLLNSSSSSSLLLPLSSSSSLPPSSSLSAADDEIIPFSDTPQICRFGPISRKLGNNPCSSTPSQSQAVIGDEPTPTAVVRHSKQITRQVPSMAALYHQNGGRTTLQAVAVGPNGEVGYVAVPELMSMPSATFDPTLQLIQNSSRDKSDAAALAMTNNSSDMSKPSMMQSKQTLLAESERMRHELEVLRRKISELDVSHHNRVHQEVESEQCRERFQLTEELRIIESTIREREREISFNHFNDDKNATLITTKETSTEDTTPESMNAEAIKTNLLPLQMMDRSVITTAYAGMKSNFGQFNVDSYTNLPRRQN